MERHSENGLRVAEFLEAHPKVRWVAYPGLPSFNDHANARKYFHRERYGALIGFGIEGDYDAALRLIDRLEIFSLLANIGDAKSLVIHPASTTHQQLASEEQFAAGVTPEFVRLSVGLENVDDLIEDLARALE